jgi:hypothetical protein
MFIELENSRSYYPILKKIKKPTNEAGFFICSTILLMQLN